MCFEVRIVSFWFAVPFSSWGLTLQMWVLINLQLLKSHFHVTQLCICIWMWWISFSVQQFQVPEIWNILHFPHMSWVYSMFILCIFFESPIQLMLWQCKFTQHMKCVSLNFCLASWLHSATSVTKIALLHTISFLFRPRSTPTPTGSISANGVPTEALDYDRLKQVLLRTNK